MKEALGTPITPLKKAMPFAYRLQRALFGQWEKIDDGASKSSTLGRGAFAAGRLILPLPSAEDAQQAVEALYLDLILGPELPGPWRVEALKIV